MDFFDVLNIMWVLFLVIVVSVIIKSVTSKDKVNRARANSASGIPVEAKPKVQKIEPAKEKKKKVDVNKGAF